MSKDNRSTCWSVTVWMPPYTKESALEMINSAVSTHLGWKIEGQQERGQESGKLHYQLMLKTPQVRFSAVKKAFPSCHIEAARNPAALENYVHKEDTRNDEFKTVENRFVTWPVVKKTFMKWLITNGYDQSSVAHDDLDKMNLWDTFIGVSIREGIECDLVGVNPQYRSCIIRYWDSYIEYFKTTPVDVERQTDKDSEEDSLSIDIETINGV